MSYTLMKFLGWGVLFAFVGGWVGWCLHALRVRRLAVERVADDDRRSERMIQRLSELNGVIEERNRLRMQVAESRGSDLVGSTVEAMDHRTEPLVPEAGETAEIGEIAETLNQARATDLTLVKGIGPKIAELCHGIGIITWDDLAESSLADLEAMLEAAGSRYKFHDPRTWAQQADLLARGRWDEFNELFRSLDHGG